MTRRYRFPAAHVLRSALLSDADNERVYGKCSNPAGHGHDYGLEVSLSGPLDADGRVFPVDRLDALVRDRVLSRLSHRLLNEDPWFVENVPTAEAIAIAIERELREAVSEQSSARVVRVRLLETRRNFFACGEIEA